MKPVRCKNPKCQAVIRIITATEAKQPGEVYSAAGVRELDITGWCEWCFDKAFQ